MYRRDPNWRRLVQNLFYRLVATNSKKRIYGHGVTVYARRHDCFDVDWLMAQMAHTDGPPSPDIIMPVFLGQKRKSFGRFTLLRPYFFNALMSGISDTS